MVTILALLLAAYAIITEVRLTSIRIQIHQLNSRIDGILELIDGDGDQ